MEDKTEKSSEAHHRPIANRQSSNRQSSNHPLSIESSSIVNRTNVNSIRSDSVQEILSHVPNWMIRWGITLIFGMLVLFLFLSWLIKYPDTIQGSLVLTTQEPPIKLIPKTSGAIISINYPKEATLKKGNIIASIESPLSLQAYNYLQKKTQIIATAIDSNKVVNLSLKDTSFSYGVIQNTYTDLIGSIKKFQLLVKENNISFTIENIEKQLKNQLKMERLIREELNQNEEILSNANKKFQSDKKLFQKGVIARSEFFEREKTYRAVLSSVNNTKQNLINREITITSLQKQLHDLKTDFNQKKKELLIIINNQLENIENGLNTWQQSYQITAPINGRLVYMKNIADHEYVEAGKVLFAIVPNSQSYIAQMKIPKIGAGKVEIGQKVMISIDNYPPERYGQLIGKVTSKALIPNEKEYRVQVELTNNLTTTYDKKINYTPEMSGTGKIITKDLRIINRIFNKLRKVFENK